MNHDPTPICRCPRCGGRMVRRALRPEEWPVQAAECLSCGWDMELLGGYWVSIARAPTPATPWPQMRLPVGPVEAVG